MEIPRTFSAALAVARARLCRQRTPLVVAWNITFRCNQHCRYCGVNTVSRKELTTNQAEALLEALHCMGTRWLALSGGEPLLRSDLPALVNHASHLGIRVSLNTNGALLPHLSHRLAGLWRVNISYDGPEPVHDELRGAGTHKAALTAMAACREAGIPLGLQCVLTSLNLEHVEDVLALAKRFRTQAMFQPARSTLAYTSQPNPFAPPTEDYRAVIRDLISRKNEGWPVANSLPGLKHMARWPDPTPRRCFAGVLTLDIEPDGSMTACDACEGSALPQDKLHEFNTQSFVNRYRSVTLPGPCAQCWCAPLVELNLAFGGNARALLNALRLAMYT